MNSFDPSLFTGYILSEIRILYFEFNKLTGLNKNQFAEFTNLESLWLFGNEISYLENGWTVGLSNLRELDLNNNKLSVLKESDFIGLDNLVALHLCDNNFKFIDANNSPFANLLNLRVLDLTGNNLQNSIGPNSFKNLNQLEELWLRACNIEETIDLDSFRNPFCSSQKSSTLIWIGLNPVVYSDQSYKFTNNSCFSFNLYN